MGVECSVDVAAVESVKALSDGCTASDPSSSSSSSPSPGDNRDSDRSGSRVLVLSPCVFISSLRICEVFEPDHRLLWTGAGVSSRFPGSDDAHDSVDQCFTLQSKHSFHARATGADERGSGVLALLRGGDGSDLGTELWGFGSGFALVGLCFGSFSASRFRTAAGLDAGGGHFGATIAGFGASTG